MRSKPLPHELVIADIGRLSVTTGTEQNEIRGFVSASQRSWNDVAALKLAHAALTALTAQVATPPTPLLSVVPGNRQSSVFVYGAPVLNNLAMRSHCVILLPTENGFEHTSARNSRLRLTMKIPCTFQQSL
jgi:hypothetical protein